MGNPTASNVAVAKPRNKAGAVFFGRVGEVTVPTDGVTPLDPNFKSVGYLTQDGVTNTIDQDFSDVIAFGGDKVLTVRTSRSETFQFGMIETNVESLSLTYGPDNVIVDEETGSITVKHNGDDDTMFVFVFEFALRGSRIKRDVVPAGQVTDLDDVQYQDGSEDPVTYTPTISALPDADGNTAYEYIVDVQAEVASVEITAPGGAAPAATVQAGKTLTLAAKATFADGHVAPVVDGVRFASDDTKKATVEGNVVTGVAEGTADITATYGGKVSPALTVTVTAAPASK